MLNRIINFFKVRTLVQRFTIVSFAILILGVAGIGWWLGKEIESGVIKESAVTAALYMDSFIAPNLQELAGTDNLSVQQTTILNDLLHETELGSRIVAFKVWDQQGHVLYSIGPSLFTNIFPDKANLARAWNGEVVAEISSSPAEINLEMQKFDSRLLQVYSPVRLSGTDQVIAIAEFYQKADVLQAEIASAQRRSWLVVGMVMIAVYILLVGFVRWAENTIERQEVELTHQVTQLTELLSQNNELRDRVQRAAANTTAINERFLRRISAELHDGPTQELGLALLRLDRVVAQSESCNVINPLLPCNQQLPLIQTAIQEALQEIRVIASGFGLPQLEKYSLAEIVSRVVRSHERRTDTKVELQINNLPEEAGLPVKITLYRLIQEALNNAHRHAGGMGQKVLIDCESQNMLVEVSDEGQGFDLSTPIDWEQHLGLAGMRERVESLGGQFQILSSEKQGTQVLARLNLQHAGGRK